MAPTWAVPGLFLVIMIRDILRKNLSLWCEFAKHQTKMAQFLEPLCAWKNDVSNMLGNFQHFLGSEKCPMGT